MDPKEEWKICSTQCGLVRHSERALLEISGKDRGAFLQGLFSQDVVNNFPSGQSTYGLFTTVKGKILADAYVLHQDDLFFLDIEKFISPTLQAHLQRYLILSEARIEDRSSLFTAISLLGPQASKLAEKLSKSMSFRSRLMMRLWIKNELLDSALTELQSSGAGPVSEAIYESIQIESGIPKLGREMDETTFPQEVGLEENLNFRKGCFLGAEVLQRIFYQGHVNRCLALFSPEGKALPPGGSLLIQNQTEVGKITASTFSYRWNAPVALGIIKMSAAESDMPITVRHDGNEIPLKILPLFSKGKVS